MRELILLENSYTGSGMALRDGPSRPGSTRVAAEGARDTFEAREIKFESQDGLLELEKYVKRSDFEYPKARQRRSRRGQLAGVFSDRFFDDLS